MTASHDDEVPDYIKKIREETEQLRRRGIKKDWAPRTVRLGQGTTKDTAESSPNDDAQ